MFGRVVENLSKFLKKTFAKATAPAVSSRFVDLAPTSSAGNAGIYFEALEFATSNEEVHNIALTGPYGSGKSSVIKTFLARYPGKPLQLSLASFLPDSEQPSRVSKQEIERSILQQILYGVESGKLPFSRFKRIRTPERFSLVTSLLITIGLACAWYLVSKQAEVVSGTFFKPFLLSNWFNYFCLAAVGVLVWKAVHSAYTNSLSLSLKSISLKDVQIAPAATDTESILNRHLDEIIYFFQSTEYDLVVIEDLDRFENPDIFITLREINGLINSNEGIKRRVRFLYALRDDIFANTDRTKFFEFIVPVIPIINHSNSVDKVVEHSQRIALDGRLNKQFVREVSRYLSDMRLIQNIFNEYLVYSTNLATDQEGLLDPNKLLAIIIYKNVIPADFAALHQQKGVLSEVLSQYSEYVATIERATRSEIAAVEALLDRGEQQILRDDSDLRKVYAMAVIERIPPDFSVIATAEENYSIAQITSGARLENLLAVKSVTVRHTSGYPRQTIDLRQLEEDVDPTRSFEERKNDISGKSAKVRKESEKRIRQLEAKISSLRTKRFNEVIRESAELIEHVFAQVGDHSDLLKYLILEGYLDDTYYQYISLFHSGRLSPNDNIFLIKIRAYNNPPPDFPLDNVAEVVASMRAEDFGQAYVLNRIIIDHMLSDPASHSERINKAIAYIAENFELSRDLFRSYYIAGSHVDILVSVLTAKWPSFISVALEDTDAVSHVARILAYAPQKILQRTEAMNGLRSFLAQNTDRILVEQLYFPLDRLRLLAIEVAEISTLADHQEALSFVVKEGLYRMSIENIKFILSRATGGQSIEALEKRHLSTLNKVNNTEILNRIELDFSSYVKDVLIRLEDNTEEDLTAILQVLLRNDVEYDLRTEFFLRQTSIFPKLSDIPPEFQGIALQGYHVDPTWGNCLEFMQSESYDPGILTAYLQSHTASEALSEQPIPNGESALPLRQFIIANDALAPALYRRYVRLLPNHFTSFQKVDSSKLRILIEEQKVAFTPENFEHLDDVGLQVLFVALNFKKYAAAKSAYALDNDFRARLLSSAISDMQKLEVLSDLDETYITRTSPVAAVVGPIIARSPNPKLDYGFEFIKAVIVNSSNAGVQVSILNRLHHAISVPEVREILQILPLPFQDIAAFGKSPRLDNNEDNLQLARWLSSRNVISSFTQTVVSGEIKINTFRKDST